MANFAKLLAAPAERILPGALIGGITGAIGGYATGNPGQVEYNAIGAPQVSPDTYGSRALTGALIGSILGGLGGYGYGKYMLSKGQALRQLGRDLVHTRRAIGDLEKRVLAPTGKVEIPRMSLLDKLNPNNRAVVRNLEESAGIPQYSLLDRVAPTSNRRIGEQLEEFAAQDKAKLEGLRKKYEELLKSKESFVGKEQ